MGATPSALLRGCFGHNLAIAPKKKTSATKTEAIRVGATPLATLGGAPGKTSFSPQIKTTAISAVIEQVGANGLEPSTSRM